MKVHLVNLYEEGLNFYKIKVSILFFWQNSNIRLFTTQKQFFKVFFLQLTLDIFYMTSKVEKLTQKTPERVRLETWTKAP